MTTIDNIMALHNAASHAAVQYALLAQVSLRSERSMQALEDRNKANEALRAALAQQAEPVRQVSWNLNYKDSTPKLNVMNSAFEDWYQQQPFATGPNKQLCRDSYAAGMGDPLVTYAAPQVAQQAEQGWQPIETVPTETEVFIGRFIDGEFKFGRSEMFYEQANEFAGETFSGWVWSEDECSSSITDSPTHWMPLPAAPKGGV